MTSPNTAEVSAEHAIWPQDPQFDLALAGGVTTMHILPGSANLFGGRGVTVKNVPARTADGDEVSRRALRAEDGVRREPEARLRHAQHVAVRRGWATSPATARPGSRRPNTARACARWKADGAEPDKRPDRNLQLETLAGVLDGEILVQNHCYRADEMATMIDIAKEFGFKIASFHHAVEAYKVRDLLAANDICAQHVGRLVGLQARGLRRHHARTSRWSTRPAPARSSTPTTPNGIQRLNQEAAKAMRAGGGGRHHDRPRRRGQVDHAQPGEGARHRQGHRLARAGQERGRRDLVGRSVQRLRPRRAGLHRRRAGVRPQRSGPAAAPRFRHRPHADGTWPMRAPPSSRLSACITAVDGGAAARPRATGRRRGAPHRSPVAAGETIAITNARMLPVSGPAIERGTVVIRAGQDRRGRRRTSQVPAGCARDRRRREDRDARLDRLGDADRHRRDPAGGARARRSERRPTRASAPRSTSSTRSTATRPSSR